MRASACFLVLCASALALAPSALAITCANGAQSSPPTSTKRVGRNSVMALCGPGMVVFSGQCCPCLGTTVKAPNTKQAVPGGKCLEGVSTCDLESIIAVGPLGGNVCQKCPTDMVANANHTACEPEVDGDPVAETGTRRQ